MTDSLKQYLELFEASRTDIDANSAPLLNSLRPGAFERLLNARLPHKGDEGYEVTDVNEMFAPDFGVNVTKVSIPVDLARIFKCAVPSISTLLGFVINDLFVPSERLDARLEAEGVKFMSLRKAALEYPDLVEPYYGSLAVPGVATADLNTLLAQDGVFIHIPAGVKLQKPLQLVNILSAPVPLAAFRRILVVVEKDAEAQLLVCDHTNDTVNSYLTCQVVETVLQEGAKFEVCSLEESSAATRRLSQLYVRQEVHSSFTFNSTTLTCGTTRNDFTVNLVDRDAEARLAGMVTGSGSMHLDNNTLMLHSAEHTKSDQLFKYVLDGEARGAFEGLIVVREGSRYTEAYQSNRNMLASGDARMHCKPQLEIYNDDVKCSHGASTGMIDNDALFYMRSRGIPLEEARRMLMQAFMADVIDTVHIPGLRERLLMLTERRFSGALDNCETCMQ